MSAALHFLHPGAISRRSGGSIYDRRMIDALRRLGIAVQLHELAGDFPAADVSTAADAMRLFAGLPDSARIVIDGLALPACATALARHGERLDVTALVHHALADETGLAASGGRDPAAAERRLLPNLHRLVVPSQAVARRLAGFGVSPARIAVVPPGTDPVRPARGSEGGPVQLLCVASLTPRKGHLTLIDALTRCADLDWRFDCAGPRDVHPATTAAVDAAIARNGLGGRIALLGPLDPAPLDHVYDRTDIFVLASAYEGYGMAFAEALARGIAVVGSGAGAVPEVVPEGAGLLVPVGDTAALAAALRRMIADAALRREKAAGARRAGARLPDWPTAARRFAAALEIG